MEKGARKAYAKTVASWRLQFDKESLPIGRGREDIPRSSPDFLHALSRYSQENFVIVEGGHVSSVPEGQGLSDVIIQLYAEMVDDSEGRDGRHKSALIRTCEDLLSPLANNENFHPGLSLDKLGLPFPFTYGFGEKDNPDILLQVVSLGSPDQVSSAAMKFRFVSQDAKIIKPSKCACLVNAHGNSKTIQDRVTFLSQYSQIVSVENLGTASVSLSEMGLPILTA